MAIPPFQQHPAIVEGPTFVSAFARDGKGHGTIAGTTMTYTIAFTGRSGAHFTGSFTLTDSGGSFNGAGTVKGFDQGFPERSCTIKAVI